MNYLKSLHIVDLELKMITYFIMEIKVFLLIIMDLKNSMTVTSLKVDIFYLYANLPSLKISLNGTNFSMFY